MNIVLRKPVRKDIYALERLVKEFAEENPSTSSTAQIDLTKTSNAINQLLAVDNVESIVADVDHQTVGCVVFSAMPSLVHGGRLIIFVDLIVVEKNYRRHGIGRQLMQAVLEYADVNAAYKIVLTTRMSNAQALAFHQSLGFHENGAALAFYPTLRTRKELTCAILASIGDSRVALQPRKRYVPIMHKSAEDAFC